MSVWTFAAMADALKALLDVDAALLALTPAVEVRVSVPHAQEDISDTLVIGLDGGDDEKSQSLLAGSSVSIHDEFVTIGCMASVIRYGSGDTEAVAARDRVLTVVGIVDDVVRDNSLEVGVQTLMKRLDNRQYESWPALIGQSDAPARVARVSFDIVYRARTTT